MKYRFVRIKDVSGEIHEFEDADVNEFFGKIIIFFPAPLGIVRKDFYTKNLISFERLTDDGRRKE